MNQDWAREELSLAELGDKRLTQRLIQLAGSLSQSPESSINQACQDWAETKGAYRFFQNENIDYKEILDGHIRATAKRCQDYETILCVQDTTYFNYASHPKTEGLCLLNRGKGYRGKDISALGLAMHTSLVVTTEGLALGILAQKIYTHKSIPAKEKKIKTKVRVPIEEKESFRWLECLRKAQDSLGNEKIRMVTICDREADFYDLFCLSQQIQAPVLVRAHQNRRINKKSIYSENTGENLWLFMKKQECRGLIKLTIPGQKENTRRLAELEVRTGKFQLTPSRSNYPIGKKREKFSSLMVNAVYLRKKNAPKGTEAIEWMLLTNLTVVNFEDAVEKVKWYCLRWRIEVFHKILKSGLRVEDCRLSTADRLIRYLALTSIVAWRIFWVTLIARESPSLSCLIFLSDNEWKILFVKANPRKKIPQKPPTIKECVIWLAQLGGFLGRKCDKDPGITHIWRGLKKFTAILEGVDLAKNFVGNS